MEKSGPASEPVDSEKHKQKAWDSGIVEKKIDGTLWEANQFDLARILAARAQKSDQWLHVASRRPIPNAEQIRIALFRVLAQGNAKRIDVSAGEPLNFPAYTVCLAQSTKGNMNDTHKSTT